VDELIPARFRGQVALAISGSYWAGAMLGSVLGIVLLNETLFAPNIGWRLAFLLGGILGLAVLVIRRYVPESPRWLAIHNRNEEAEATVGDIEGQIERQTGRQLPPVEGPPVVIDHRDETGFGPVLRSMFVLYPRRTVLGLTLLASQAFLYNAIFFTYGLILAQFYNVPDSSVPYYIFPFALGNLIGPLLLGRLFDTVGRVPMISGCYIIAGLLLAFTGYLFLQEVLTAVTQTILWCIIFFFASAAASAAYLTVSEVFPMEVRALAIAIFYAIGTGIGGVAAPFIFARLTETGDRPSLFIAYLLGAGLMIFAAIVELLLGVRAEGQSLESIAAPLTAADEGGPDPTTRPATTG
jgi:MFS family permease